MPLHPRFEILSQPLRTYTQKEHHSDSTQVVNVPPHVRNNITIVIHPKSIGPITVVLQFHDTVPQAHSQSPDNSDQPTASISDVDDESSVTEPGSDVPGGSAQSSNAIAATQIPEKSSALRSTFLAPRLDPSNNESESVTESDSDSDLNQIVSVNDTDRLQSAIAGPSIQHVVSNVLKCKNVALYDCTSSKRHRSNA